MQVVLWNGPFWFWFRLDRELGKNNCFCNLNFCAICFMMCDWLAYFWDPVNLGSKQWVTPKMTDCLCWRHTHWRRKSVKKNIWFNCLLSFTPLITEDQALLSTTIVIFVTHIHADLKVFLPLCLVSCIGIGLANIPRTGQKIKQLVS